MLMNTPFPGLCEGVRVGRDDKRGWFVQAIRDLPSGELICIERGIVVSLPDSNVCDFCLAKSYTPLCTNCFMQFTVIRRYEEPFEDELKQLGIARLAYRIVLSYAPMEINDVLEENSRFEDGDFEGFFSIYMLSKFDIGNIDAVDAFCSKAQKYLHKNHPLWSQVEDKLLFRKAFYAVATRLPRNAHTISHQKFMSGDGPLGTGIFPLCSLFNHSCRANVFSYFKEDKFYFISRGVRAGEELLDDYGMQAYDACYDVRQRFFQTRLNFTCECSVCTSFIGRVSDDLLTSEDKTCLKVTPFTNVEEIIESSKLPIGHIYKEIAIHKLLSSESSLAWPVKKKFIFDIIHSQAARGAILRPEQVPYFVELMIDCPLQSTTVSEFECWVVAIQARIRYFYQCTHPMYTNLMSITLIMSRLRKAKKICKCTKMDSPLLSGTTSRLENLREYMKRRSDFHTVARNCL